MNCSTWKIYLCAIFCLTVERTSSFSLHQTVKSESLKSASLFPKARNQVQEYNKRPFSTNLAASSTTLSPSDESEYQNKWFTFNTKFGYLNPFAIYCGLTSILLGLPWFVALTLCQVVTNRFDKMRRLPIFFSHIWGWLLLRFTLSSPTIEGLENLNELYKQDRAGMFVANHNSWMDIPFLAMTIGWRNYKIISKAELGKVPILGKAIKVGGHVMVDRSSRKSQLKTFKDGIKWLETGVHLCAFPEGTRTKTGRLLPFKNGAFKMAERVGAPIIPLSIVGAGKVHPANWIFPRKASRGSCRVIIHRPIETTDKTEDELVEIIRSKIISGLPEDQHPLY